MLSAGFDWLTATARPDETARELAALGGRLVELERDAGNRQREWHWRGYHGLTAGAATVGGRDDGVIVRASGALAADWARALASLASNVSRVDLQVTWLAPMGDSDSAVMALWRARQRLAERGRPSEITLIRPERDGPTVYVGKRSSDQFGRIYDKHGEDPTTYPPGAVRAEIEIKGETARANRERIAAGDLDSSAILALARRWYRRRGIPLQLPDAGTADLAPAPRSETDAQRALRWLAGQAAPTVARSVEWSGLWPTLRALGLADRLNRERDSSRRAPW